MWEILQSDWYSPTRLRSSPTVKFDFSVIYSLSMSLTLSNFWWFCHWPICSIYDFIQREIDLYQIGVWWILIKPTVCWQTEQNHSTIRISMYIYIIHYHFRLVLWALELLSFGFCRNSFIGRFLGSFHFVVDRMLNCLVGYHSILGWETEYAWASLVDWVSVFFFVSWQELYRQKLEDKLTLDSEGKPFRMLVFRGSPKLSRRPTRCVDEMRRRDDESEELENNMKQYQPRSFPQVLRRHTEFYYSFYSVIIVISYEFW